MTRTCRILLFILLLFPNFVLAADTLSGKDLARLVTDEAYRVFKIHFEGDVSLLEKGTHFVDPVLDESRKELRFRSKNYEDATGRRLSCLVGQDRAQISLKGAWPDAANDIAVDLQASPLLLLQGHSLVTEGVNAFFRSSVYEFKDRYYEIVLSGRGDQKVPEITLGYYLKTRAGNLQTFAEPKAVWEAGFLSGAKALPSARVCMARYTDSPVDIFGIHTLEIEFNNEVPVLVFTPGLYPMWKEKDAAKKGYIKEITAIRIDDAPYPGFRTNEDNPLQDLAASLTVPISKESFELISKGEQISFDLTTTLKEKTRVVFPLKGAGDAAKRAVTAVTLLPSSPLMARIAVRDYNWVEEAILDGADVNQMLPNGLSPLHLAANLRDSKMVLALGEAENLDTEVKNSDGDGYLHLAANYLKDIDVLEALLDIGCDPDSRDNNGRTPLSRTVCYDGFDKIDVLLSAGADINADDKDGFTPLHHTVRNRFSSPEEAAYLIKRGADKNRQAKDGSTPLMTAIDNQCWNHIRALLDEGVDLSLRDKQGMTALDKARYFRDHTDLAEAVPVLALQGETAVRDTQNAYKDLAVVLENKAFYHYGFHNRSGETVYIALRLLGTDDTWTTKKWYKLAPRDKKILARSGNSIFYFYARSDTRVWKGTDNRVSISGKTYGMRKIKLSSGDKGKFKFLSLE
ncbi:MAG TPA: hypothetical protein DHV36_22805 [Desulfobacteraceae bacterium]|nr:hypothetical protein [Desulfobacteraceae bacterium]